MGEAKIQGKNPQSKITPKAKIMMDAIKQRRSVRQFKKGTIPTEVLRSILEAGRWAPSGLNNQPWRFMILKENKKDALAQFTHYGRIVRTCDKLILVFLDKEKSYHYQKDIMALGACIQNMLLYIHQQKLGACWLGEILNRKNHIGRQLRLPETKELFGCIALGIPARVPTSRRRRPLQTLIDTV